MLTTFDLDEDEYVPAALRAGAAGALLRCRPGAQDLNPPTGVPDITRCRSSSSPSTTALDH